MALLVVNTLDHCKGMVAQFQIAPWVSGGPSGNPLYIDVGEQQGLDFQHKTTQKKITPSNRMFPTDKFTTEEEIVISLELLQADLNNLSTAMGRYRSLPATWTPVAGVPYPKIIQSSSGSAILPIGEPGTQQYFSVQIRVLGQNMMSVSNPGYPFTCLVMTFWRCVIAPATNFKMVRDDEVRYKFSVEPVEDSTVGADTQGMDLTIGRISTLVVSPAS